MECGDDNLSPGHTRPRAVSAVGGDEYVCPFLFDFLNIRELGRAAAVCRTWKASYDDDELWREMYERTQLGETGMDEWAKALASRPFGEEAVGWEVEVLREDNATWQQGLVLGFSGGRYRVEYADGTSRWESEYRTEGPWHRRGNSRLYFTSRLHDSLAGEGSAEGGGDPPLAPTAAAHGTPPAPHSARSGVGVSAGRTQSAGKKGVGSGSPPAWPRLKHGCWKEELKANACHVPTGELIRLADHTDEVLDLKFSPDGTRLATCSRDMSILIYAIEEIPDTRDQHRHRQHRDDMEEEEEEEEEEERRSHAAAAGVVGLRSIAGTPSNQTASGSGSGGGDKAPGSVRRDGEEPLRPLPYGRLGVKLIHRLQRSATASVCRIFWSPCSKFILSCLEEPHGNPFNPSSSELWDALHGQWLSRCRSQPFDVHAAWFPDGKHFVAGLDIAWDETDETVPFSQTLAIRRRPNLYSRPSVAPLFSPTPMPEDTPEGGGGGGGGGGACVSSVVDDDGPGVGKGEYIVGGSTDGQPSTGVDDSVRPVSPTPQSEGVGWGEETLSRSPGMTSSSASLSLLRLDAEQRATMVGGATRHDAGDGSTRGVGVPSLPGPATRATSPQYAAGASTDAASASGAGPRDTPVASHEAGRGRDLSNSEAEMAGVLWVDPDSQGKGYAREGFGDGGVDDTLAAGSDAHVGVNSLSGLRPPPQELQSLDSSYLTHGARSREAATRVVSAAAGSLRTSSPADTMVQYRGDCAEDDADRDNARDGADHKDFLCGYTWPPVVAALGAGDGGDVNEGVTGSHHDDDDQGVEDCGGLIGLDLNVAGVAGIGQASAGGGGIGGIGGGGGGGGGGPVGDGQEGGEGGVEWVMAGGEAIAEADEAEMPLVAEVRLSLSSNFAHFFQLSNSGFWACMATGDTPLMCHRLIFIPIGEKKKPPPTQSPPPASRRPETASSATNTGAAGAGETAPAGESGGGLAHDVHIRVPRVLGGVGGSSTGGDGGNGNGDGSGDGGSHQGVHDIARRTEGVECGGAVLSLTISRDDRFVMANVRPFMKKDNVEGDQPPDGRDTAPEISNEIEMQVWDVATKKMLFTLGGHHAFTTKDCPFLILAAQSAADPFGDYVCSGSEEHRVFVWHLRHRLLLSVLKGHTDVVNSVSWNPKYPGLLASCSDDGKTIIWGPQVL